jgi:hypothetical protein
MLGRSARSRVKMDFKRLAAPVPVMSMHARQFAWKRETTTTKEKKKEKEKEKEKKNEQGKGKGKEKGRDGK